MKYNVKIQAILYLQLSIPNNEYNKIIPNNYLNQKIFPCMTNEKKLIYFVKSFRFYKDTF